jgi:hypothetical protein
MYELPVESILRVISKMHDESKYNYNTVVNVNSGLPLFIPVEKMTPVILSEYRFKEEIYLYNHAIACAMTDRMPAFIELLASWIDYKGLTGTKVETLESISYALTGLGLYKNLHNEVRQRVDTPLANQELEVTIGTDCFSTQLLQFLGFSLTKGCKASTLYESIILNVLDMQTAFVYSLTQLRKIKPYFQYLDLREDILSSTGNSSLNYNQRVNFATFFGDDIPSFGVPLKSRQFHVRCEYEILTRTLFKMQFFVRFNTEMKVSSETFIRFCNYMYNRYGIPEENRTVNTDNQHDFLIVEFKAEI